MKPACIQITGPTILDFASFPDSVCAIIDDHVGHDSDSSGFHHLNKLIDSQPNTQVFIEYASSATCDRATAIPWWFIQETERLKSNTPYTPWKAKYETFSFMVNKLRGSRARVLESLIRNNLHTNTYTLVSNEYPEYPPQYYEHEDSVKLETAIQNRSYDNITIYNNYTRKHVFEPAYIHIITEPGWLEQSTFITEKSVFPFEAGCIPIWSGGWKQPSWFRSQGFDVFDDIVDHSYEDLPTANQRLQASIELNKNLLQNKDLAADFFEANQSRFEANRKLIRSDTLIAKYVNQINDLSLDDYYKKKLLELLYP
jgi:hypothetical protein